MYVVWLTFFRFFETCINKRKRKLYAALKLQHIYILTCELVDYILVCAEIGRIV